MLFLAKEIFDQLYMQRLLSQTIWHILTLSAPMLLAAIGTGLAISIFQATTQIQEQTLSFVPKIVATFVAVILCFLHTAEVLREWTIQLMLDIGDFGPPPPNF